MQRLTTETRSEKCTIRRFRHCVNVIERTYTNLDSTVQPTTHHAIWYSLLLLGYKPLQHVTVLNTVGNRQYSIAYCTPRYMVQPIAARLQTVQHVTVLNTVGKRQYSIAYCTPRYMV